MVVDKEQLWKTIITHEGETFTTSGRGYITSGRGNIRTSIPGKQFKYEVSRATTGGGRRYSGPNVDGYGNELWITTIPSGEKKRKSISRSTVDRAFQTAMEMEGCVKGPKALNVPGAGSYLYPIFLRIGVITAAATLADTSTPSDVSTSTPASTSTEE